MNAIYEDITSRDDTDYLGLHAVNRMADDAIIIDTTHLTIDEQIEKIVQMV